LPETGIALLQTAAEHTPGPTLWLLDEQAVNVTANVQFVTNRYDIFRSLQRTGCNSLFNDFDFSTLPSESYRTVLYRISKEKALVHHLINNAWRLLQTGGELLLCGAKNEGIKTYLNKARALFGGKLTLSHHSGLILGQLVKSAEHSDALLDDQDYVRLRVIGEQNNIPFLSKPGVFGWNKIDAGSALLAAQLPAVIADANPAPQTLLDLGCGYGYLALRAHQMHTFQRIVASDNNAAALLTCRANFKAQGIAGQVIADDCGTMLSETFDLIVCNPPFHRGFEHEKSFSETFLAAATRLLAPRGCAVFVVNRFIPLERLARSYFRRIRILAENRSFKVLELSGALTKARSK